MYYMLSCFGPVDEDRTGIGDILNTNVNWQTGSPFHEPPPSPVQVELNPDFPGVMVPMFDSGILLFADAMLEAIRKSGVDNLDVYDAVITDPTSGQIYSNYKAVNIIGTIAAADLGKSEYQAPSGSPIIDADFDSLVLDETKIGGMLMFRLAEAVNGIVIHERVKAQLEQSGIADLDFTEPGNWIG